MEFSVDSLSIGRGSITAQEINALTKDNFILFGDKTTS